MFSMLFVLSCHSPEHELRDLKLKNQAAVVRVLIFPVSDVLLVRQPLCDSDLDANLTGHKWPETHSHTECE